MLSLSVLVEREQGKVSVTAKLKPPNPSVGERVLQQLVELHAWDNS